MKFTHKIMVMPILAAVAFIVVLLISWRSGNMNQLLIEQIEDEYFRALEIANSLEKTVVQVRHTLQTSITIDDEELISEADSLSARYRTEIANGRNIKIIPNDVISDLSSSFETYYQLARPVTVALIQSGLSEDLFERIAKMNNEYSSLQTKLIGMTTKQKADMEAAFRNVNEQQTHMRKIVRLSIFIALILIVISSIGLTMSIVGPLRSITNVTEAIAEGDLDKRLDYRSGDEIGRLTDSFRRMQLTLKQRIEELRNANNELTKANSDLKAAQTRLIQAEKMASLGKLVAGVAHEFNNPIGAIQSSVNTLDSGIQKLQDQYEESKRTSIIPEDAGRKFEIIHDVSDVIREGTRRVAEIVKKMKAFARLDEAEIQKVDIHDLIKNTAAMFDTELKTGVSINYRFDEFGTIVCYPAKLNQLFFQLISNANQAVMENGEITISTQRNGDWMSIEVADNGVGIKPEFLDKIFDPGYSHWSLSVGVGLGLAICHTIVEDHHGEIKVDSQPGNGTTVSVSIPCNLTERLHA